MHVEGKITFDRNKVQDHKMLANFFNLHFSGWSWNNQTMVRFWFSSTELNELTHILRDIDIPTVYISYLRIWYDVKEILPKVNSIHTTSNLVSVMDTNRNFIDESLYDFKNRVWTISTIDTSIEVKWWSSLTISNSNDL